MNITVRDFAKEDLESFLDYWYLASDDFIKNMGADRRVYRWDKEDILNYEN